MQDSIWFRTLPRELRDSLQQSTELPGDASFVIVGAGMVGLLTAYYLTEAGAKNICVIDRSTVLGEASGSNAGGLWFAQQSREMGTLSSLVKKTQQLYEELDERFDFDLRKPGMLQLCFTSKEASQRSTIVKTVNKAGFRAESISAKQVGELEPKLQKPTRGAVFYPDEGCLHPGRLAARLARYLREKEVTFALGVTVEYFPTTDYAATVTAFARGDVQMAWFGGLTGVQARSYVEGSMAIAQRERDTSFHSVFINNSSVEVNKLRDLKGLRFAFGSESSTSGHLMPRFFLESIGINAEKDFDGPPIFSGSHDKTWLMVQGLSLIHI